MTERLAISPGDDIRQLVETTILHHVAKTISLDASSHRGRHGFIDQFWDQPSARLIHHTHEIA